LAICTGAIQFKIAVLTYRLLHSAAPRYLGPFTSTADVPGQRALHSAGTSRLVVPPGPPSVAKRFQLAPLKSGTPYRNTLFQLPHAIPSGITWKCFYYNNFCRSHFS